MAKKERKCTITLSHDEIQGYSWSRRKGSAYDGVIGGGGHDTLIDLLLDIEFLNILEQDIGPHAVPREILEIGRARAEREKLNRVPIPQSLINGLQELGYPIDEGESGS